jgi:hypothetical protein
MITSAPWCSLVVIRNCPHLKGDLPARLCSSLEVVLVPYHKDVISHLDSKVAAGESESEQRTTGIKWRQRRSQVPFNKSSLSTSYSFNRNSQGSKPSLKLGTWLTSIILTTWEAEIGGIMVQACPGINNETLFEKHLKQKGLPPTSSCMRTLTLSMD